MWLVLITPSVKLEDDDWWLRDQSVFRLLSAHHWGWLEFEVRGHKHKQALTCTPKLSRAPHASGDKMFVIAAAAAVCMSISLLPPTIWLPPDLAKVSSVTVTILICVFFFSSGFIVQDHHQGLVLKGWSLWHCLETSLVIHCETESYLLSPQSDRSSQ